MKTQRKAATHSRSSTGASNPSRPASTGQGELAFPCVEMRITADVTGKNATRSLARMVKLWRAGTSLVMDDKSVRRLFPDGGVRRGAPLRVGFGLPAGPSDQMVKVAALCEILGSRRVGEDLHCVDLRFTSFAKNSRGRVERFILDSMSYEWS